MRHGFNVGDEVTFKARNGQTYDGKVFGVGLNLDYHISYTVNGKERYTFSIPSTDIKKKKDMKQENRGGYRPGSGRKPKDPDDKRVQMVVSVDPDTRDKLKEISRMRNIKPGKVIDEMVKGEW